MLIDSILNAVIIIRKSIKMVLGTITITVSAIPIDLKEAPHERAPNHYSGDM